VQRILGHSEITSAEYVKVAIGDLKEVVESKHPREKQY
jgi:site-specific recombinase XerD